ncbi:MAG: DUF2007 domain-containing protein [Deltaproteobacteria bacterium]|nr:DUF2007 domain-containing protein [Deltaproteobacteria bacterium]
MIRLTTLENRFETDLITGALEEDGIEFVVKRFEDSAYDGLFVTQKGYALLLVEEISEERARAIVEDIRKAVAEDPGQDTAEEPELME